MSKKRIPAELRRLVIERARGCCEYCGAQAGFSSDPFTVDHIIPRSLGGSTNLENLAYSCFGCNQHKSVRVSASDPVTESLVPLFHPRRDPWKEHFARNNDFTLMLGLKR
jgi:5-methylcytosine-specific restriction endonuclease McrA